MSAALRILIVEDLSTDAELCEREIQKIFPHSVFRCVETREDYLAELDSFQPDMILSDYKMPSFDGMTALKLALERVPETPFIIITGSMNEETAVDCMKAGAWDYVIKEHMKRLGPAVITSLKRKDTLQENRRSEEKRRESESLFRKLFEDHAAVKLIIDPDNGNIMDANTAATKYYGWSIERIKRMNISEINTVSPEELLQAMRQVQSKKNFRFEFRHRKADGAIRDVEVFSSGITVGGKIVLHSVVHDITDRKHAEKALSLSEAKYRAIFENAIEGIYQSTTDGKYISVNPAFSKILGYKTPEELIGSIIDIASQVYVNPEDRLKLLDLLSVNDLVEEFEFRAYRKDGSMIWLLANARAVRNEDGSIDYFEGRVQDITQRKGVEEKLQNTLDSLRRAVGVTIQVMMSTVGKRDPYTASHQMRSAELARAIASEMGLPAEKIEGVRIAGIIHDIGKISIPAEILSKAAKLTAVEFSFVKEHAWIGYEILKDVESPWPLAEIVYQHHERMDGSGYPRNLKGDEILMEARILAVTDVVESMASHRPYRPALGIDAALGEIEKNKGTLYDASVVDTCLRLFRENGFQFKAA